MRLRETIVEHQMKTEKATLKMNWIVVTEHGKQQLRMMWTVVSPILTVGSNWSRDHSAGTGGSMDSVFKY